MPFQPGFDRSEAEALIAMLAPMEGQVPALPPPPLPLGWVKLFESPSLGVFDNRWELWHDPVPGSGRFALLVRGTVQQAGSIIDDLLSVMLPAAGKIMGRDYRFAGDSEAGVHLGFALAALVVLWDQTDGVLKKLPCLVPSGSEVYIAGHSQGAAIATLIRSYLEHLASPPVSSLTYKTYTFALPRPGNSRYADEYNAEFANTGMSYRVINSLDWVPQSPLTLESLADVNTPNPISVWFTARVFLEPIHLAISALRDAVHLAQVTRHKPQLDHLSQKQNGVSLATAAAMGLPTDLPAILPSLDFEACGSPFLLIGTPGTNPTDPHDFFWQHHASMYDLLLSGGTIPTVASVAAQMIEPPDCHPV